MKKIIENTLKIFFILLSSFSFKVYATSLHEPVTLRIAILDNFSYEKFYKEFAQSYMVGIAVAKKAAQKKGFLIQTKVFSFGISPLAVLDYIQEAKAWKPDLIIGPHSSNDTLLIKKCFNNILVISSNASSNAVTKMPKNFYSLTLPVSYLAKANLAFMKNKFPGKDVFLIAQADSSASFDTAIDFKKIYKKEYPRAHVAESFYTGFNETQNINIPKLLSNYKHGSIIYLQSYSFTDELVLMNRISDYLKDNHLTFLINMDSWWEKSKKDKNYKNDYSIFKVTALIQSSNYKYFKDYTDNYHKLYNSEPKDLVGYKSYASVMSVIDTLSPAKLDKSNLQKAILAEFLAKLKNNKNWYRPTIYKAYKLEPNGNIELGVVAEY